MADGTYVKPPHAKSSYATMILVRVSIVKDVSENLKFATTIATRYSVIRRQVILNTDKAFSLIS